MRLAAAAILLIAATARAQIDPRGALLERTGGCDRGRAGAAAARAFRDALAADPKNARLHLGAGVAAVLERRDADARNRSRRARARSKLARARALLGQVLYRLGDLSRAIRTYETLTAETPDDKDARDTLERWRARRSCTIG
jgi:predicted Zn-dependent protease